jgi:hypothetical protein
MGFLSPQEIGQRAARLPPLGLISECEEMAVL